MVLIMVANEIDEINGNLRWNPIKSPASDNRIETEIQNKMSENTPSR